MDFPCPSTCTVLSVEQCPGLRGVVLTIPPPPPSTPPSRPSSSHRLALAPQPTPCLASTCRRFSPSLWVTGPLVSSFQVKFFYLCQLAYWLHALPELYFQKVRKVSTGGPSLTLLVPTALLLSLPLAAHAWGGDGGVLAG